MGVGVVPYIFADQAGPIPLEELDANLEYVSQKVVTPEDYEAVGDGLTNNFLAFARMAADALLLGGLKCVMPAGNYLIDTNSGSITLNNITFEGIGVLDGFQHFGVPNAGSNFFFVGTAASPFLIRRGVTFDGVGVYYPDQVDSPTPIAYPPTLDFDFSDGPIQYVEIKNCVVYNAYRFCRMDDAAGGVGHCWFERNSIYGILTCFEVTRNVETIHFKSNDFTFGVWLAATESGCRGFTRANGIAIKYDYGDGIYADDNLFGAYLRGISIGAGNVLVQLSRITNNAFDGTRYGIYADGSGNFTTSTILGNTFYCVNTEDTSLQAVSIALLTTGAGDETLEIVSNIFALSTENHILVTGNAPIRQLNITGNSLRIWAAGKVAGNYAAIDISGAATGYNATGNTFHGTDFAAFATGIKGSVNTAVIGSNKFFGCFNAVNFSAFNATLVGNFSVDTVDTASDLISATTLFSINNWDKPHLATPFAVPLASVGNYANDAAALAAGVPLGGMYRTGSALMMRSV